jgi:dTDP-4-amino-4,6-dideoxygalactose transaminase
MHPGAFFDRHREGAAAALLRVLDSGWYVLGSEVSSFEKEFAEYFGFDHAVGVANGTDAIALALRALGVGHGDRVATVSHTAVATAAAIEMANASPVFVDVAPDTCTMDPASLARTLEHSEPVKAVIAVHLYGHCADMPAIGELAVRHGSFVIEDCSQAHGARLNGRPAGTMGDLATFSFYPTKNLGALGDGGAVVARDPAVGGRLAALRQYGWTRHYISDEVGINSRLDELQAAILRVKLRYLDAANARRQAIARAYDAALGARAPRRRRGSEHVYHLYVVRTPDRDQMQARLRERGVGSGVHYPVPVHLQPAYAGRVRLGPSRCTETERAAAEVLSLPLYPELTDDQVAVVCRAIDCLTD